MEKRRVPGNGFEEVIGSRHDSGRRDRRSTSLGVSSKGLSNGEDGWGFFE